MLLDLKGMILTIQPSDVQLNPNVLIIPIVATTKFVPPWPILFTGNVLMLVAGLHVDPMPTVLLITTI